MLAWLCFFEMARILFLVYHHAQASQLSLKTILLTFVYGFRMDLSMGCYLLLLPSLLVLLSAAIPFFAKPVVYKIYSGIVLFLLLVIVISDMEIYQEWGYRLDSTVLQYLSSPKEVIASTGHLPVVWILFSFVLVFLCLIFLFNKIIDQSVFLLEQVPGKRSISALILVGFMALLVIPIRGGIQMQPMNPSWVYFSSNNFANISALNAPWNFFQDVMDKERGISNPYRYLPPQQTIEIVDSLYRSSHAHVQLVDTASGKPNVILIIWESFTSKATWSTFQGKEATPNINRLKKEGIFFSNVYASGDRTHKGMAAIFSGYPALPNTSIIRFPQKSAKLTLMSNVFRQHGYTSTFFYGGDPNYDNYKSYLLHGEFDKITDKSFFNSKDEPTEWGALDGAVASYMEQGFRDWKQPFFNCWLTLTSHVPYKIPVAPAFQGSDDATKFLNSIHYTDEVIGNFIEDCKKQPWWKNTLIVITADHGMRYPRTGRIINDFKIPMLWLGGAVEKKKGLTIEKLSSQIDLSATLMKQLGWNSSGFPFSRDITDSTATPFAFFSNSVSFGLVQPNSYFIYDVKGNRIKEQGGPIHAIDINRGKGFQQFVYDDYLKK